VGSLLSRNARVVPRTGIRVRDPHSRRTFQCGAVGVHRWPVHHGIAGSAVPADVSAAAVSEACDVADEDLIRPEGMPVRYLAPSGVDVVIASIALSRLPQFVGTFRGSAERLCW
jgi:hypothetical protein